ncbi:MAG: hypothetical protein E7620_08030 [Ruminococcaceae bacterium]|nr:hypothetical protein [Oscillospiraceae bacterium]
MARNPQNLSQKQLLTNRYNSARANLLLVVLFTLLNVVLLFVNADYYLLFSASIPFYLTLYAMLFCGKFPPEYYGDAYEEWAAGGFYPDTVLYAALVIVAVILAIYLLSFFLSKNGKSGWLVFALVLFIADTIGLFLMADLGNAILDLVFHAWVLGILISGISAASKLKKLPEEEEKKGFFEV